MNQVQEWRGKLSLLSVYRGLLRHPVIGGYSRLLQAAAAYDAADPTPLLEAWGAWMEAVYAAQAEENLCGAVTDAVLYEETGFSKAAAAGKPISETLRQTVGQELSFLLELAQLTPEALLRACGAEQLSLAAALPRWQVGAAVEPIRGDAAHRVERLLAFYRTHGCGMFARYRAFIWRDRRILPIAHPDPITLSDLKGYEIPRNQVLQNTEAFLQGLPANNCLLYGDRGTGKSSTVKAIMNACCDKGLRVIEMPKESLLEFPYLVDQIAELPLYFLIFIDDLSFSNQDETYASLKAVLEGGVASRPGNTLIYATSNRRHLLRETFSDRAGDEIHRNDTIEENLSLADRFGLSVNFSHPGKSEYLALIRALAVQRGLEAQLSLLEPAAEQWALLRGGRSPRTAIQFLDQAEAKLRSGATKL